MRSNSAHNQQSASLAIHFYICEKGFIITTSNDLWHHFYGNKHFGAQGTDAFRSLERDTTLLYCTIFYFWGAKYSFERKCDVFRIENEDDGMIPL